MTQFGQAGIANASGGRTVISLTDDYVQSLDPGDYQFTAEWTDGDYAVLDLHIPEGSIPPDSVVPTVDFGAWARYGSAVAEIPAPYAKFVSLMFDGEKVPVTVLPEPGAPANTGIYGVTATALPDGSTQLALHHDYLKALPREVEHTFTATFGGGWPEVTLTLTPAAGFQDVSDANTFHEQVHWMLDTGLSTGWVTKDDDDKVIAREYYPGSMILRNSMAAFLFRISGETETFVAPVVPTFADVPRGASFYREIEWMAARGISTGWEIKDADGNVVRREFRPAQRLTRESAATFLYRLAGADYTFTGTMFADITGADPDRKAIETAVEWMVAKGISTGTPSKTGGLPTFNPGGGLQRDSLAAFIYRAVNDAKVVSLPGNVQPGDDRWLASSPAPSTTPG